VHNAIVVADLERRGAVFVEELDEVPEGATVVFSAHGVAPSVRQEAAARDLDVVDATCPLVGKVHHEARRYARQGNTILFIGHAGHEETEGTLGEEPEHTILVQDESEVDSIEVPDPDRVSYLMQTTLAVDEADGIVSALRRKFPALRGPSSDDICYATTNRQSAVKQMAAQCDLVLVIGSRNSSNSNRLVDVARDAGAAAYLIDNEEQVREEWLDGVRVVGISSGASAPEELVGRLVAFFRVRGVEDVSEFEVLREDVRFMLPKTIRQALTAAQA
jgi:4-hydroxy-3-methylbut-2-enyl diphosphate reductase